MDRRGIKRLEQLEAALLSTQRRGMTISVIDPVSGELVDFSRYNDLPREGR